MVACLSTRGPIQTRDMALLQGLLEVRCIRSCGAVVAMGARSYNVAQPCPCQLLSAPCCNGWASEPTSWPVHVAAVHVPCMCSDLSLPCSMLTYSDVSAMHAAMRACMRAAMAMHACNTKRSSRIMGLRFQHSSMLNNSMCSTSSMQASTILFACR